MKKSRSSTPRLDARCPGLEGTAGAREDWDAEPRVAMAVGNTLEKLGDIQARLDRDLQGWSIVSCKPNGG